MKAVTSFRLSGPVPPKTVRDSARSPRPAASATRNRWAVGNSVPGGRSSDSPPGTEKATRPPAGPASARPTYSRSGPPAPSHRIAKRSSPPSLASKLVKEMSFRNAEPSRSTMAMPMVCDTVQPSHASAHSSAMRPVSAASSDPSRTAPRERS